MLTDSDPEPSIGTVVQDALGTGWIRINTGWVDLDDLLGSDPRPWTHVAGDYGPVEVREI